MNREHRELLAQLVGLYGAAAVAKEARALERPPRKRGPRAVEGNSHAVWLVVEIRRDRGACRRPHSVTNACNLIRNDLKKLLPRRPIGVQRLRQMHAESIAEQRQRPDLGERLAQRLLGLRQERAANPGIAILPALFKFGASNDLEGQIIDARAAETLGGVLFIAQF
ncbi:MAG TPA: hypothetical protein VMQ73_18800 [Methylomirabilota bacterium]|nr:hypothetical protein [Methylomirabilota bacterium]